jgi:hypothetical protein
MAGRSAAGHVARLTTTCPATAASYGAGCTGSAGPLALTATSLPWLGGTLAATTTGLTTNSLAVGVFGFGQIAVPLASVHPRGGAGCFVFVTDDILVEFAVASGTVHSQRAIPTAATLLGAVFHHLVVPVELDAQGRSHAITSSNALAFTIGSF